VTRLRPSLRQGMVTVFRMPGGTFAGGRVHVGGQVGRQVSGRDTTVLGARQNEAARETALARLWDRVAERGWLTTAEPRVVVRVADGHRSPLAVETARSLVERLAGMGVPADLVDGRPAALESVGVAGILLPELHVPAAWLDAFMFVTVTGAGPDPDHRLGAILAAQAEPLRWAGTDGPPTTVALEAHRLGASDLAVVCGDAEGDAWWLVSPSDLAVEIALARACGVDGGTLPLIRALAAHESVPAVGGIEGALPRLGGLVGSGLSARMRRPLWAARGASAAAVRDAAMIRRNLGKLPGFVRRKLAARRPRSA
jgi:hypothetical protein